MRLGTGISGRLTAVIGRRPDRHRFPVCPLHRRLEYRRRPAHRRRRRGAADPPPDRVGGIAGLIAKGQGRIALLRTLAPKMFTLTPVFLFFVFVPVFADPTTLRVFDLGRFPRRYG